MAATFIVPPTLQIRSYGEVARYDEIALYVGVLHHRQISSDGSPGYREGIVGGRIGLLSYYVCDSSGGVCRIGERVGGVRERVRGVRLPIGQVGVGIRRVCYGGRRSDDRRPVCYERDIGIGAGDGR